jgi:hypothetical protein
MLELGLLTPGSLKNYFTAIEPQLYRYPALDPASFKLQLGRLLDDYAQQIGEHPQG